MCVEKTVVGKRSWEQLDVKVELTYHLCNRLLIFCNNPPMDEKLYIISMEGVL